MALSMLSVTAWDHPRIRGEHFHVCSLINALLGSPPHTRGTHWHEEKEAQAYRITPAYAGNTGILGWNWDAYKDHPRIRGEHFLPLLSNFSGLGSPPHTRGTLLNTISLGGISGITPAYAGNTTTCMYRKFYYWDHPRLRGEHLFAKSCLDIFTGSPPLTRGTQNV